MQGINVCLIFLQEEEFYVITWEAKKEEIFEMPTGGAAIANKGPNLLKLARKEQCLALLAQLRSKFKTDGVIYRYIHYFLVILWLPRKCLWGKCHTKLTKLAPSQTDLSAYHTPVFDFALLTSWRLECYACV